MCQSTVKIYDKDLDFLDKIKKKYGLRSKAITIKLIIKKIKHMKVEGELR